MKTLRMLLLQIAFVLFCVPMAMAEEKVELTVYTGIEPEMLAKYSKAFAQKHPNINIQWMRDSAGPITARLQAEKDAPRADVIFGLALNSILHLEQFDMFETYIPQGVAAINERMRDMRENPTWVGINAWATAVCVNRELMRERNLPEPKNWDDLLDPVYQGQIIMPNPVSSSTGYMAVAGWIQGKGEDGAWEYMKRLHPQMSMYVHSGSRPGQMVAQGEIPMAITSAAFVRPFIDKNAPIDILLLEGGAGWDMEAVAIVKNRPHIEEAKLLMDFACSEEVAQIAAAGSYLPGREEFLRPEDVKTRKACIPMDFYKSAAQREAVLTKWRQLFEE